MFNLIFIQRKTNYCPIYYPIQRVSVVVYNKWDYNLYLIETMSDKEFHEGFSQGNLGLSDVQALSKY